MNIECNYAIIKYYKSYNAVIILVIKKKKVVNILHHFLPQVHLIIYPELVGFAHVGNNGSDYPSAIIQYAQCGDEARSCMDYCTTIGTPLLRDMVSY